MLAAALAISLVLSVREASAHHYDHLLAGPAACGGAKQTNTGLAPAELELVMRCMHDQARTKAGRKQLTWRSVLATSSDAKTADMMRCSQFSHNACGRSTLYHVHRVGYTSGGCWGASENIAWGSGRLASVRSIMSGWLHSDGHRSTILSTRYRDFGMGVRKGTFQSYSGAHVWTGHFGYRC
jgi:uncharacterized protein YkwD